MAAHPRPGGRVCEPLRIHILNVAVKASTLSKRARGFKFVDHMTGQRTTVVVPMDAKAYTAVIMEWSPATVPQATPQKKIKYNTKQHTYIYMLFCVAGEQC